MTIQAPFELVTPPFRPVGTPSIALYERGELLDELVIATARLQPRIISRSHLVQLFPPLFPPVNEGEVYHAEGRLEGLPASGQYPAQPGEALSFHAVGLGRGVGGSPRVVAGQPSPPGVRVDVGLAFEFGKNPVPRRPEWFRGDPPPEGLISAALVPGRVGIYEVRFRVPSRIPPGTPSCADPVPLLYTNAAVSVGSLTDFRYQDTYDGTRFCVEPPPGSTGAPSKQ